MKKHARAILMGVLPLVLFNVIAFAAPFSKTASFWIAYVFAMVSILLLTGVSFYVSASAHELKSRFYGWPIIYIAFAYLLVQIALSLIFMAFSSIPAWIATVISAACLCVALFGIIAADAAKEEIQKVDAQISGKVFYIKSLETDINCLVDACMDPIMKKTLKELSDAIRYSDPMSNDSLYPLESKIENHCAELAELLDANKTEESKEICTQILRLLNARNQKCKLLK